MLKHPLPAVVLHWVFQSLFYMDPTERWFKIGLDGIMTGAFMLILGPYLLLAPALILSFLAAHTLNFLLNGQLWGALKQYGLVHIPPETYKRYVLGLSQRGCEECSIQHLYVYGSLARQEWTPASDLDVRLVRYPGLSNGLRACWFVLKERSRALFVRFPMDIYVVDRMSGLEKLRSCERALDLLNPELIVEFTLMTVHHQNRVIG